MALTNDEIRDVLARAQEIQRTSSADYSDIENVVQAAEEVGISRSAVERALRERNALPIRPPSAGDLVFAKGADNRYYVAEVIEQAGADWRVRFLRGSEHVAPVGEIRPCSFLPGERVMVNWPWWGEWNGTVVSYDAAARIVHVSDGWMETKTFPIGEVWIKPRPVAPGGRSRARVYAALLGAGAAVGAAIGALITAVALGALG